MVRVWDEHRAGWCDGATCSWTEKETYTQDQTLAPDGTGSSVSGRETGWGKSLEVGKAPWGPQGAARSRRLAGVRGQGAAAAPVVHFRTL